MKIVQWDDDKVPAVVVVDDGTILVEDSMYEYDLEEGDLIQYMTEIGTSLYIVADVAVKWGSRGIHICTIESAA